MKKLRWIAAATALLTTISTLAAGWEYRTVRDEMTDGSTDVATLRSTNKHDISYPNGKGVYAVLMVTKGGRSGERVAFSISSGQIQCSPGEGCGMALRIDDSPIEYPFTNATTGGNPGVITIEGFSWMITALRQAKTLRIEVPIYQNGRRTFTFNPAGLTWRP